MKKTIPQESPLMVAYRTTWTEQQREAWLALGRLVYRIKANAA